ncbi:hypothetical protein [uncultured Mediterranean phage]|nr:hypothetical protein [uncultured Mediterranean phage]
MSRPTHELFYIEEYIDKTTGQPKKKRVVWAKGWENEDKFDNGATYYKFPLGKQGFTLFVKKVRPERPMSNQGGYQAQQQGYQPPPPQHQPSPPPQSQEDYGANDPDIPF